MQQLEVGEKEGLVFPDRTAERTAVDVLDELGTPLLWDRCFGGGSVGLEKRGLIKLKEIAVKAVRPRSCNHQDLCPRVATKLGRGVGGDDAKFGEHVGILVGRRGVRTARGSFVVVDAVEDVVEGTIT